MSDQVYNCPTPDCAMSTAGTCNRCGYGVTWGHIGKDVSPKFVPREFADGGTVKGDGFRKMHGVR